MGDEKQNVLSCCWSLERSPRINEAAEIESGMAHKLRATIETLNAPEICLECREEFRDLSSRQIYSLGDASFLLDARRHQVVHLPGDPRTDA